MAERSSERGRKTAEGHDRGEPEDQKSQEQRGERETVFSCMHKARQIDGLSLKTPCMGNNVHTSVGEE